MGIDPGYVKMQLVTREPAPLALFGQPRPAPPSPQLLEEAGIAFRGNAPRGKATTAAPKRMADGKPLDSQRVVALPTIEGPVIIGVPADDTRVVPVDEHGRVAALPASTPPGATSYPIKQGGLACQQADAVAEVLAAAAGADVHPTRSIRSCAAASSPGAALPT